MINLNKKSKRMHQNTQDNVSQDNIAEWAEFYKNKALQADSYTDRLSLTYDLVQIAKNLDCSTLHHINLDDDELISLSSVVSSQEQETLFRNIFNDERAIHVLEEIYNPQHKEDAIKLFRIYHMFSPSADYSADFVEELWEGLPDLSQLDAYGRWSALSDREKMECLSHTIDQFRQEKIDADLIEMGIDSINDVTGLYLGTQNHKDGKRLFTQGQYESGFIYFGGYTDDPQFKRDRKILSEEWAYDDQDRLVTANGYPVVMHNFDDPDALNRTMRHELTHLVIDNLLDTRDMDEFTMRIGYHFDESDYALTLASRRLISPFYKDYKNNAEEVLARHVSTPYEENADIKNIGFLNDIKSTFAAFGIDSSDIQSLEDLNRIFKDDNSPTMS